MRKKVTNKVRNFISPKLNVSIVVFMVILPQSAESKEMVLVEEEYDDPSLL